MIKCDENCEDCRKYTTFHTHYDECKKVRVTEYDCIVAGKNVRKESEEK